MGLAATALRHRLVAVAEAANRARGVAPAPDGMERVRAWAEAEHATHGDAQAALRALAPARRPPARSTGS